MLLDVFAKVVFFWLAVSCWRLAIGCWLLAVGCWLFEVA